jgi:hypothetical protein
MLVKTYKTRKQAKTLLNIITQFYQQSVGCSGIGFFLLQFINKNPENPQNFGFKTVCLYWNLRF